MRILAIDLGTQFGWAKVGHDGKIFSGAERLEKKRGDSQGIRFLRFGIKIKELVGGSIITVDAIAFEKPHARGGAATEILHGMRGVLLAAAENRGLQTIEIRASDIKMVATGKGNANKKFVLAAAYKRWPEQFYPRPEPANNPLEFEIPGETDPHFDQADALWLLEAARQEIGR